MHTEREREHEKKEGEKTNVKNTREVCVCLENLTYFSRPQEYILTISRAAYLSHISYSDV